MKAKKNSSSADVNKAKNLVRGALSRLRATSTPEQRRDPWLEEQVAQKQINRAMAIAKRQLAQTQFVAFEKWVVNFSREQNRESSRLGSNLTALGLLPTELKASNLATELQVALEQLVRNFVPLITFARSASELAHLITRRDWSNALSLLRTIRDQDGYSYWAIETELALIQAQNGIDAVKTHIATLSICAIGLNKFFLYHFGVRNEPAQTSARFKVNLKKRIEESEIPIEWQVYSKFRLYNALPSDSNALASVLAGEQLTTGIDLLFTVIKVARYILAHTSVFSDQVVAITQTICQNLSPITSALGISTNVDGLISPPPSGQSEFSLSGYAISALDIAMQAPEQWGQPDDLNAVIRQGIASLLSTRSDGVAAEELAKTLLNLSWLPAAIEIGDPAQISPLPQLLLTSADLPTVASGPKSAFDALHEIIRTFINEPRGEFTNLVPLFHLLSGQTTTHEVDGSDNLLALSNSPSLVVQDASKVLLAHFLYRTDSIEECLCVCANVGMENDRLIPMLPLAEILQGAKWASLRTYAHSMNIAITLDHFLTIVDDRKIRTYKRYAVEELLKIHGASLLIDLVDALANSESEKTKLEYFFYHVCDIVTIELLPGMGESRKVWSMRSQILRKLSELHTRDESGYLREAEEIDESLLVDDGLFVLDDSKVYVDEQPILKSINLDLAADFQRYLRLVESGIGVSESLNEVLKGFRNVSARTFQIPKNDADDLLAHLIQSILDKFLFDSASGLDTIIGRRIRHGTIAGEIRGHLEGVGLIGHKPHAGADYQIPVNVENQFAALDPKRRRMIGAAFSRFSEVIDQHIALLRDDYFCVKSETKPRGLFDVPFTTILFALARSIAQTCQSIDQFSKECIQLFWFLLSARLDASRPSVEMETKKTLASIFEKLTNELRAVNFADPAFFTCLLQASEELQRRASTIAGWIRVPKSSVEGKRYSLQRAVDVAGAVVTGQRAGFSPIVTSEVPDNPELDTHGFSIVEDALYIAFDNIAQHSGKKVQNHVVVNIIFNPETSLLTFTITNEVAPNSRTAEREARVNGVRADIQKRAYGERARLNRGGSGLAKLASIVMQHDKTSIWFGYTGVDQFQLKFDLVYVGLSSDPIHAPLSATNEVARPEAEVNT